MYFVINLIRALAIFKKFCMNVRQCSSNPRKLCIFDTDFEIDQSFMVLTL